MANQPPSDKHYFVKTDRLTFAPILRWIQQQRDNDALAITAYREIQSRTFIRGNDQDDPQWWSRMYDFARTVHATMRYHMLDITGLREYHDPDISEPARSRNSGDIRRNQVVAGHVAVNHGHHLASSSYEAQWVTAHYDMLFPHFHIEQRLDNIGMNQRRVLEDQLVIVDTHHHVVWNLIVTLTVTRLDCRGPGIRFEASPFLAVYRMEPPRDDEPLPDPKFVPEVEDLLRNLQL